MVSENEIANEDVNPYGMTQEDEIACFDAVVFAVNKGFKVGWVYHALKEYLEVDKLSEQMKASIRVNYTQYHQVTKVQRKPEKPLQPSSQFLRWNELRCAKSQSNVNDFIDPFDFIK